MHRFLLLSLILAWPPFSGCRPSSKLEDRPFLRAFHALDSIPQAFAYESFLDFPQAGGHLQGIQAFQQGDESYFFISGSSDTLAYYALVKADTAPRLVQYWPIMSKPFKHAGGFQLQHGLLALGVEDNARKDRSKVLVYQLTARPPLPQLGQVIERSGPVERATAGAVAHARFRNYHFLIVGDWDSRHLDVYGLKWESGPFPENSFMLLDSLAPAQWVNDQWVDPHWWSYQNLNLFAAGDDHLWLVGLGTNDRGQNVADVFALFLDPPARFRLQKVASRRFASELGTSFRWGAGMSWDPETRDLQLYSCSEQVGSRGVIARYP